MTRDIAKMIILVINLFSMNPTSQKLSLKNCTSLFSKRKLKIWSKGNYSIKNKEYLQISVGEENYISYSTRFNYLFNFETKELFFLNTETNKLTKIE